MAGQAHHRAQRAGRRARQRGLVRVADSGPGVPAAVRDKHLRPLLHHQGRRHGHRHGLVGVALDRPRPRRRPAARVGAAPGRRPLPPEPAAARRAAPPPPRPGRPGRAARRVCWWWTTSRDRRTAAHAARDRAGFEVASADVGAVALELLDTARFDAIVSDLRMPDMDGAALWRACVRHPGAGRAHGVRHRRHAVTQRGSSWTDPAASDWTSPSVLA
jgi:hypothetical protein